MGKNLYVGNLSYDTSEDGLRTLFSEYGEITSVNVITDRETGRPRGFAFVEMATEEGAQSAMRALNGKMVDNREIKVNEAKPRADRDRRPGGGGRRQGGERRPRW
jgi:RNA recognition motif-containing protein